MLLDRRILVAFGLLAAAAGSARAQVVQAGKDAEAATVSKGRLGGSATLSNDVGIGTFVRNDYSDDPYFQQSLRLLPTYGLFKDVSVQADETFYYEWTSPSDASAGPAGRHWAVSDLFFRIRHASLLRSESTGINLWGTFSAAAPLSHESRWRNYITRLTATTGIDRTFLERLTVNYILGVTKYFPTSSERGELGDRRPPSASDPESNRAVGINPNFAFRNEVGVSYRFTDRFSAGMLLRFTTYLKYKVGSADDPEQNPTYNNRHTETYTLGDISGSYALTDRYSVGAGITSEQLMWDSRGNARFPFFDFETSQQNYTTIYVTGTATF